MLGRKEMIGPWAGLPVAWKEDLSFDEQVYRQNVARACKAKVPGVYTGGTTGEFYAMDFDEFKAITRATVEECKKQHTPVIIGVTSTFTLGAQRRAAYAAEVGADAIQVALPFWLEVPDSHVVPFFKDVASACEGLAMSVYETCRCKKALTLDQHRAIREEVEAYVCVKSNADTLGCNKEGCARLSEFVNVWVNECLWSDLGPVGAIGCASAMVFMNPRVILHMFKLLQQKKWAELKPWTDMLYLHHTEGLDLFVPQGFSDTAYDHMHGVVAGFLKMSVRSRGPYPSATEEDVRRFRAWMEKNVPELLKL